MHKEWSFAFQTQAMTGHSIHHWLDGSPYAFQNWYKPSPQTYYHGHANLEDVEELDQYFNPNKFQPQFFETEHCATVFNTRTRNFAQWIAIPCRENIPRVTFVCESKINYNTRQTSVKRNIYRAIRECPGTNINFNSSCLHFINYVHRHNYTAEKICYAQGMPVFQLPQFVIFLDPKLGWVSWNQENSFFLKFLLSMAHRSPSLYSRHMDSLDIIVAEARQNPGKVSMFGVQYSEANLANVHVINMHNNFSSGVLYIILCDGPMLISNGYQSSWIVFMVILCVTMEHVY